MNTLRWGFAIVWAVFMSYGAVMLFRAFRAMRAAERSFRALKRYDVLEAKSRHGFMSAAERTELAELRAWIALEAYRGRGQ